MLFFIVSCSQKVDILGIYRTEKDSRLKNGFSSLFGRPKLEDIKLQINPDSTYVFQNCSQTSLGKWIIKNDTLSLICNRQFFNIDSLNYLNNYKAGLICDTEPFIFLVRNNSLSTKIQIGDRKYLIKLFKN
jgi:hypothetical protein